MDSDESVTIESSATESMAVKVAAVLELLRERYGDTSTVEVMREAKNPDRIQMGQAPMLDVARFVAKSGLGESGPTAARHGYGVWFTDDEGTVWFLKTDRAAKTPGL